MENTEKKSYCDPRVFQWIGWIVGGIILAVVLAFIFGYFVMLLWNWIMPALFGLPEIDYWMGFGIIILARLIFGGIGHNKPHEKSPHHDRYYGSKFRRKFHPPFNKHTRWNHYEDFWKEEGEEAFEKYLAKKQAGADSSKTINPVE